MAFSPSPLPFLLPFLLLFSTATAHTTSSSSSSSSSNATIYQILPLYGLPPGIFPDSVTSFSLSSSDGTLSLNLSGPCYLNLDYLIYYDPYVTAILRYGSLTALSGIQARRFLIWFDVDRIKVDLPPTNYIYFDVGWITRKLGIDQFFTIHSCKSTVYHPFQWTKGLHDSYSK